MAALSLAGIACVTLGSCHSSPVSAQGIHAPCTRDKDCVHGLDCLSGVCMLRCEEPEDCPHGYRCRHDFCVDGTDGGLALEAGDTPDGHDAPDASPPLEAATPDAHVFVDAASLVD